MSKVSIGLRGWRFDEDEVFEADGTVRPLGEIPPDARQRIVRLATILGEPCDACYLIHREPEIEQCNVGQVVYGEPLGEVVLCDAHEPDFLYWFREEGGRALAGETEMQNAFHEWFAGGGRAPGGYEGVEHVEREPDGVPDPTEAVPGIEDELAEMDDDELDALDVDLDDLDL
jgi:hypothetical protein